MGDHKSCDIILLIACLELYHTYVYKPFFMQQGVECIANMNVF